MAKNEDNEVYFCQLLKEAVTDKNMSKGERVWSFGIGLIGTVVSDPIKFCMNKLGINDDAPMSDSDDPSAPQNMNY